MLQFPGPFPHFSKHKRKVCLCVSVGGGRRERNYPIVQMISGSAHPEEAGEQKEAGCIKGNCLKMKTKESRGREGKKGREGTGGERESESLGNGNGAYFPITFLPPSPLSSIVTECGRLITEGQRD